jgi:cardiolipin synthase
MEHLAGTHASRRHPRFVPGNSIQLLLNGEEYFPAIEHAFAQAGEEIYLESYIFENDATGRRIAEALKQAAERGVRVHVLLDGFGSRLLPRQTIDYMTSSGVAVMVYRPKISPWTLRKSRLRRLHRKLVVVDGRHAFVGGINIIDDMDTPGHTPPRYDYAVAIEGPLVREIHVAARSLWRRVSWMHLQRGHLGPRPHWIHLRETGHMRAAFVTRDNFRHRRDIENAYLSAINAAHSEIILANAYFLPGVNFRRALVDAVQRGVRVVLLLQGRVEYLLLHYATRALYGSFLDAGLEIHEYQRSFLHAKVAVIDGKWATVGSSNIDPFSLLLSREANVVVDDSGFAGELRASLMQAMDAGARQVVRDSWKKQHWYRRFMSWMSYGIVRFLMGMVGYAREQSQPANLPRAKRAV